jgi:hypothetical protein
MSSVLKMLRIVHIAMLISIGMYVIVGELIASRSPIAARPAFFYVISVLSITTIGVILVVRRTLVLHSESTLRVKSNDLATLNRWRTGYIITYALSESLALFGLIVRVAGFSLSQAVTFYLPGFVLMLFFRPRPPSSEFSSPDLS